MYTYIPIYCRFFVLLTHKKGGNAMLYTFKKYYDHYVVVRISDNAIMAHCDTPAECREEIELLLHD